MTDIIPRLEKLAALLRHDDEAREICEDAIREIARLSGAPVPATLSNPNAGGHVQLDYWRMMQIKFDPVKIEWQDDGTCIVDF